MSQTHGVRYEMELVTADGPRATYTCTVHTATRADTLRVTITGETASADDAPAELDRAHLTQLLAIARTLGRRADEGAWPRRIHRWRAPGVR